MSANCLSCNPSTPSTKRNIARSRMEMSLDYSIEGQKNTIYSRMGKWLAYYFDNHIAYQLFSYFLNLLRVYPYFCLYFLQLNSKCWAYLRYPSRTDLVLLRIVMRLFWSFSISMQKVGLLLNSSDWLISDWSTFLLYVLANLALIYLPIP